MEIQCRFLSRFLVLTVMTVILVAVTILPALAEYPAGNIRVYIHTKAGGGTDTMARLVWKHATRLTGTRFVIENSPGAGGQIGYTKLALSQPDGYTLGAITTLSIATHELTRRGVLYSLKENFRPIGRVVLDPSVVVVRADSPFMSVNDIVISAKRNPGKINWGGTFLYGVHHIHYIMFNRATGAELQYVPFDGGADSRAALLGGHIDVGSGGISEYADLAKEGKLRILVVGSGEMYPDFPDVPTYNDLGYDIEIGSSRGFAVPSGTPDSYAQWLDDIITRVIMDPQFQVDAAKAGIGNTVSHLSGKKFAEYLYSVQSQVRKILPQDMLVKR